MEELGSKNVDRGTSMEEYGYRDIEWIGTYWQGRMDMGSWTWTREMNRWTYGWTCFNVRIKTDGHGPLDML